MMSSMSGKRLTRRDLLRTLGWGPVSGLAVAGVAFLGCRGQLRLTSPGPSAPLTCPLTCPLGGGCSVPCKVRSSDGRP